MSSTQGSVLLSRADFMNDAHSVCYTRKLEGRYEKIHLPSLYPTK